MKFLGRIAASLAAVLLMAAGEAGAACDPEFKPSNFTEFRACTYREPQTGIWIVDGDVPVVSEAQLRAFYDALVGNTRSGNPVAELIVNRTPSGADDRWADNKRCGIRYCVSKASAGSNYNGVVSAMAAAADAWANNMGVRMVHAADQDNNCTSANAAVDFDVQVTSGQPYYARAFFPSQGRATRNVMINTSSFSPTPPLTLEGVLRHELGHALGFRHEHTRPEAGTCFEDNSWRPLTPYDSASVMHYPQCKGTAGWALVLSAKDIQGGQALYGSTTCSAPARTAVDCTVFNDGYSNQSRKADALYFRANGEVCIPDGSASGTCRKWFGRCTTSTGEAVKFKVFNDGYASEAGPFDAVYVRQANSACIPDGTATGKCRRWVGRPQTAAGKAVQCYLFDDGYRNMVGPSDAIYAAAPNRFCMPDGTASGTCRRWFGRCETK